MFIYEFIFTAFLWKGWYYPLLPLFWERLSFTTSGCFMMFTMQFFNNFAVILAVLESFIYSNHRFYWLRNCVCSILENENSRPKLLIRRWRRQLPRPPPKAWPARYKTRGRNKTSPSPQGQTLQRSLLFVCRQTLRDQPPPHKLTTALQDVEATSNPYY